MNRGSDPKEAEAYTIRCPRLGGPVTLAYCETAGEAPLPCWKIMDCWWERFDVKAYLETRLTAEEMRLLVTCEPAPKIVQIAHLTAQAMKRATKETAASQDRSIHPGTVPPHAAPSETEETSC